VKNKCREKKRKRYRQGDKGKGGKTGIKRGKKMFAVEFKRVFLN
jgi:hypothetical protein